jgi:EAL domain-containing protein (putative c-di-GMP-specific phosphodiesterase class I)
VTLTPGGCEYTGCAPDEDRASIELVYKSLACDRLRVQAQPIIGVFSGEVHAVELLVRIAADDGRLLLPEAFLPAAERHGLMPRIDRLMVEHAAALSSCGRAVNVNLSATTIADGAFFDDVVATMRRHRAEPSKITFEITETAATTDLLSAARLGTKLETHGFRIAIDDFGSGWGAFRYLRLLPVSVIKIDREFIRDLARRPKAARLVRGVVDLARGLGHRTVGEGVEDGATLAKMRAIGIDYAQGFYLGPPRPVEEALGLDARRRLEDCGLLRAR